MATPISQIINSSVKGYTGSIGYTGSATLTLGQMIQINMGNTL